MLQTLSRVLKEELTFDRSHVTSLDCDSYPILTFPEMPNLIYDLIDRPSSNVSSWSASRQTERGRRSAAPARSFGRRPGADVATGLS